MDYSENMISQARSRLHNHESCEFLQGNLYNIPLPNNSINVFISVRTIHHLPDLNTYAEQVFKTLAPKGHLIVEIPNKRHILNVVRWCLLRHSTNPFSKTPLVLGENYVNFHPKMALSTFRSKGFHVKRVINTNFLRSPAIKRILPVKILVLLDQVFGRLVSWANLSPSVFVLLQKPQR